MDEHLPLIEPCGHGRYKLSCTCGWKARQRFISSDGAGEFWKLHRDGKVL